jgi:hypothetical protein
MHGPDGEEISVWGKTYVLWFSACLIKKRQFNVVSNGKRSFGGGTEQTD